MSLIKTKQVMSCHLHVLGFYPHQVLQFDAPKNLTWMAFLKGHHRLFDEPPRSATVTILQRIQSFEHLENDLVCASLVLSSAVLLSASMSTASPISGPLSNINNRMCHRFLRKVLAEH